MTRVKYFDSLRLFAIFLVYVTHFIDSFHPEYFSLWTMFPTSRLLEGMSGKMGVALFGVLLGYFAYMSKEENAAHYILKRYIFFVISGLVVNSLYWLKSLATGEQWSVVRVLVESITLDEDIFPTYWCIPIFFAASIISFLNGKAKVTTIGILLEIAVFYKLQYIWLVVCLMGNLVARYKENPCFDLLKKRVVRIALWGILFFAVKRPECNTTYIIHGTCCAVMIMLVMRGNLVKSLLENNCLAMLGRQGMAIYILHPICYMSMAPVLFRLLSFLPYAYRFVIAMLLCFAIITALSFPTMKLIDRATNYVFCLSKKCLMLCEKKAI